MNKIVYFLVSEIVCIRISTLRGFTNPGLEIGVNAVTQTILDPVIDPFSVIKSSITGKADDVVPELADVQVAEVSSIANPDLQTQIDQASAEKRKDEYNVCSSYTHLSPHSSLVINSG